MCLCLQPPPAESTVAADSAESTVAADSAEDVSGTVKVWFWNAHHNVVACCATRILVFPFMFVCMCLRKHGHSFWSTS